MGVGSTNKVVLILVVGVISSLTSVWLSVVFSEQLLDAVSDANSTHYYYDQPDHPLPDIVQVEPATALPFDGRKGDSKDGQDIEPNRLGSSAVSFSTSGQNKSAPTLALMYPTGLWGGYRNQAMRFVAFCKYATDHEIPQLLLPSLLWSTRYPHRLGNGYNKFWPVPFEILFDVDHWNSYHQPSQPVGDEVYNTTMTSAMMSLTNLPLIVPEIEGSDCWRVLSVNDDHNRTYIDNSIFPTLPNSTDANATGTNGTRIHPDHDHRFVPTFISQVAQENILLTPLADIALDYMLGKIHRNRRNFDPAPLVQRCRHPMVYGGGRGAGVLWNDYVRMPKLSDSPSMPKPKYMEAQRNTRLIASIHSALRPAPQWRRLAQRCVHHYLGKDEDNPNNSTDQGTTLPGYVVLHGRVETEMMVHKCGISMEKNLTTILNMVENFVRAFNDQQDQTNNITSQKIRGTLVAVGREGIQVPVGVPHVDAMAKHNWEVLNEMSLSSPTKTESSSSSTSPSRLPLFECGELWVEKAYLTDHNDTVNTDGMSQVGRKDEYLPPDRYKHDYGDIIPSMINFWLAVEATAFVGVEKSSWSTDVWAARYYRGKGDTNFQYTVENGVVPVPNNGRPTPHKNC